MLHRHTHLGIVLGITSMQGNSFQIQTALEVDSRDNVPVESHVYNCPGSWSAKNTYCSTGTSPCTAVISGTLAGGRMGGAEVLPYVSAAGAAASAGGAEVDDDAAAGIARPDMLDSSKWRRSRARGDEPERVNRDTDAAYRRGWGEGEGGLIVRVGWRGVAACGCSVFKAIFLGCGSQLWL